MSLLSSLLTTHDTVLITTDLEPDDIVCLDIVLTELVRHRAGIKRLGIITNVHNCTQAKRDFVRHMLAIRFPDLLDIAEVMSGRSTPRGHPYFPTQDAKPSPDEDGTYSEWIVGDWTDMLVTCIFGHPHRCLYLMISPPHDVLAHDIGCSRWGGVFEGLSRSTLVGYMSYNVRQLLYNPQLHLEDADQMTRDRLLAFMARFRACYWYETFHATGHVNTITDSSLIDAMCAKIPHLSSMIDRWNQDMLANRARAIRSHYRTESLPDDPSALLDAIRDRVMDDERLKRSVECAQNILAHPRQILQADIGLACLLTMPLSETAPMIKPVTISFDDDDYTTYEPRAPNDDLTTGMFLVCPDGGDEAKDQFRLRQLSHLRALYASAPAAE